jgi:glycosyltransferase involved in cell wall biosynthesis
MLSVIIPSYNEAATLGKVVANVRALHGPLEIIVVDDGSTDGTREVLAGLAGPDLTLVLLPENRGKGAALRAGIERATGEVVAIQDADLELEPAALLALAAPVFAGGADAVFGSRFLGRKPEGSLLCRLGNRLATLVANQLFHARWSDLACGQKAIATELLRSLALTSRGFEVEAEIAARLAMAGARIGELPVPYTPRDRAQGKKTRYLRDGLRVARTLLALRFCRGARRLREVEIAG